MKKIILFLIISFVFINSSALTYGGCDYSTVSRMKSIVKNINISYDYSMSNGDVSFSVTINNLTNDIYFYDYENDKNYYYSNTNNGEITIYGYDSYSSGKYKFYSNNNNCKGIALGTKYYNFPKYNTYYTNELCADIPNFSLCQKWADVNYNSKEFEKLVLEYKKGEEKTEEKLEIEYEKTILDIIVEFYINYYYYIFGIIILIGTIVIIIYNRKNRFKL